MKKKKVLWIILLIIGLLPFIAVLTISILASIFGFSGLCLLECSYYYGFEAFRDSIILFSFVFWPAYIVGLILIIISIIFLKRGIKKCQRKLKNPKQ